MDVDTTAVDTLSAELAAAVTPEVQTNPSPEQALFDEIDTGVSGRVSGAMADLLRLLSRQQRNKERCEAPTTCVII